MNCRAEYYRIGESKTLIAGLQNKRHSLQSKWHSYRITLQHRQRPPVSHCSSSSAELAGMVFRREDRARGILAGTGHEAFWRDLGDPCCRTATQRPLLPECRVQVTPAARLQFRDPCCQNAKCRVQVTPAAGLQSAGIESQAKSLPGKVAGLHTITSDAPRLRLRLRPRVLGSGSRA